MGRHISDHGAADAPGCRRPPSETATALHLRPHVQAHGPPPPFMRPAFAARVDAPPEGRDWLFEAKFDGYRAIVAASGPMVRIHDHSGMDWTGRFPALVRALAALDLPPVLLDGEIVALDAGGVSSLAILRRAVHDDQAALSYYAFDLLAEAGRAWHAHPLIERKARLASLLGEAGKTGPVFYTDHVVGGGAALWATLCEQGFDGVIAKRVAAPHRPGHGHDWLEIRCGHRREFVVVGWSPSTHGPSFTSLLLGAREEGAGEPGGSGELRYAGQVGSGFDAHMQAGLETRLRDLERPGAPVPEDTVPPAIARQAHWVKPELLVMVAFAGFTGDRLVRQGRFLGLRGDSPALPAVPEAAEPVGGTPGS
ncbi:non-homologous end-joining DNA ligase [Nitrospirillum iridis]|uniref:DNA ligase (ATP) n=1 Tax=Nitrospirillum iridis TaxID=765888 RepID=A0A7X0EDM4_9PROT|nr:non-homologous end-joining DNA ligase [Nitrospirillum iridis]MBB6252942.1 DNA ligase D-like protein (predicted ligase) [Nitrospirillum iridis]